MRNILKIDEDIPICRMCGNPFHWIGGHVSEHAISIEDYLRKYPSSTTVSRLLYTRIEKRSRTVERQAAPVTIPYMNIAGSVFRVYENVPDSACLPMPPHYRIPTHGDLALDIQRIARAISKGRSLWVYGPSGSGKDAFPHAVSHLTHRPGLFLQVVPGADLQSWRFTRSFTKDGTYWEDGVFLKAVRDGYVTSSGERVPYMILLSDIDRATPDQLEELRSNLDSIQGRVIGADGKTYDVLPGTMFIATANTNGTGDQSGKYISSNPIDFSIMDRFERCFRVHHLDWRDEEIILKAKFPDVARRVPKSMGQIGACVKALREAVAREELFGEISHRLIQNWVGEIADILADQRAPEDIVKVAARVILDKFPSHDQRTRAETLMDPHVKGGVLEEGDASHIQPGDLAEDALS